MLASNILRFVSSENRLSAYCIRNKYAKLIHNERNSKYATENEKIARTGESKERENKVE